MNRIVCAAMMDHTGVVTLCVRHWDSFCTGIQGPKEHCGQGFIDKNGKFLTRTQAWKVAEEAGQIIRRVGGDTANGGTLYSENLY